MKHLRQLLAFCLLAFVCVGAGAEQPLPPAPTRWATDKASYLREDTRARLDAELQAYERSTQHQVIVWIGTSLDGVPIEDFAARAMKAWGIGRKEARDGVVLFVFAKDRKARIEVGYGLEDKLPDAIASRILRDRMVPKLKAGDPDGAVEDGVHAILATLGGGAVDAPAAEPQIPAPAVGTPSSTLGGGDTVGCIITFVFFGFFIFIGILIIRAIWRGRGGGGGTSWGGGSSWSSSDSSSSWSSSDSGSDFSGGGGDSGGGGASADW